MAISYRLKRTLIKKVVLPLLRNLSRDGSHRLLSYQPDFDQIFCFYDYDDYVVDALMGRLPELLGWRGLLDQWNLADGIVLDVGGGIGTSVAAFAPRCKEVHVFEPNPENAARIREHLRIRGIANVVMNQAAVSDAEATVELSIREGWGHHSIFDNGKSAVIKKIEVPAITLDGYLQRTGIQRVACLKIDVEGAEREVLLGAGDALTNKSIERVLFEYTPRFYKYRGIDPRSVLNVLLDRGYKLYDLKGMPVNDQGIAGDNQMDLLARAF